MTRKKVSALAALVAAGLVWTGTAAEIARDVVIYGSTPAAITAAIAAGRQGKSAVIVCPETRIGGLTTGGLGQTDIGNKQAFGGLALQFYRDVADYYRNDANWKWQKRSDYLPDGQCAGTKGADSMWTFEPHAALDILERWEKRDGLDVRRGERLDRESKSGVEVEDGRIRSIKTISGNVYRGKMFVDATYEGDLMAAAGVGYTVGREANSVYGETLNGIQTKHAVYHQFVPRVDPYVKKGDPKSGLLPNVEPHDPNEKDGDGDRRVQAYCFRMCLTDVPENRIPFAKPANYDERDYELLLRNVETFDVRPEAKPDWTLVGMPWINSKMPNRKTDTNNRTGFSTDFIGRNWQWAEASYAEREKILREHLDYQRGLMWTLANHPRVPAFIREEVSKWGTCRDEFKDGLGDGWQGQLYVREARRMVGDTVMTEHHCRGKVEATRPVAMAAYTMDSHNVRRYVGADGFVRNEGDVEVGGGKPYGIDYGAIVPKRGECGNLFVPVCLSASHIAFGSIRMEPVFFALGQAAGTAAAQAIDAGCAVQDLPYAPLAGRLLADGQVISLKPARNVRAGERIVHLDEMDHLANRTALFNAGASVEEARYGVLMLHFATTNRVSYHKRFFPISVAPKEKDWVLAFRCRFDSKDGARELGLRLYFGDPKNPETRLLTMREEGSFFEGGAKPSAPKEGAAGFLYGYGESGYGAWNSAAITVSDNVATFWAMRGGKYVADCTGKLPAKPLVGWNLVATAEKTDFRFDRLMVVDGRSVPYERGDLQEAIAELRKEPPPAWDAAFGAAMKSGEDVAADLANQDLSVRFRAPFRRATKTEKAVGCAFELVYGDKKSERIAFGAGDLNGEAKCRVFKGGKFEPTSVKTTITNCVLTATGSRLGLHTVPPIRHWGGYETEEINELIAAQDAFRKPADRTYELKVVRDGENAYRVSLDGQLLKTVKTSAPVTAVRFVGDAGAEARYALTAAPERAPETYELPMKKGGFKLERVRENMGTFMLECNGYLQRDAFQSMPSSCLWNVPRKQWARAKARCRIDPTAPPEHVPVITARLTHFYDNGGRSIAMCQETVDLSKDDARVRKSGDEYEVTFDFDIASIMDLTSMTDGCTRAELPYLHFEFTGPVWEKNRYYIDAGRSPAEELRSSVIVLGGSLEESPVWFRVTPERPYSLYYPGETPKVNVEFRPVKPGKYAVDVDVRQNDGGWKAERYFHIAGDVSCGCRWPVELPTKGGLGLYTVSYRVTDEAGKLLQKYETSYGLLPENTREAGYDSPYYSWNFRGAHGTAPRFEDWAPAYDYLGVKRTLLDPDPRRGLLETNANMKAHGFTHAEFPFICPRDDSEKAKEDAKRQMRRYVSAFPHCKQALVFHEAGGGPFPKELYGEKTELNDWAKTHQSNRVAQATRTIKCWHEVDPSVKMIVGNSGESYGLISELMRGGLDKSLVDSWGEESVGLTMPPEMTTAFTPWCIKRLAKIYGYTEKMDCPWEWKCRTERYERSFRGAAAVNLRDDLIAHALGYKTIPVGCGTETANSYADTIWCSGTFSRWPMAYPRENALAVATQTLVLDRAKYRRQLKTGSLTAYALEFEAKDGKWIYALWTARGETTMKIEWSNGGKILGFIPWKPDYELVTMLGRRSKTDSETVAVGDEPIYLISEETIDFFETAKRRTFKYENPAALAANREVQALASAAEVTLDFSEDCRIDPGFDANPFRPGKFAAKDVIDEEKGACIELTHLSQQETPEIMQEYVFLKIREPKTIEKPFDTIGVWAKGNSSWGRVSFEITDAEGERWYSSGLGGVGSYVYDWPAKLAFNYDGWNFLQAPLTGKSDVKITGPGENQWLWTRDGSGNSRIDWPVKVTAIGVSQFGMTLDLLDMKPSEPSIRIKGLSVR